MNIYLPEQVKITRINSESPTVKLFRLQKLRGVFEKKDGHVFNPGQFILLGDIGYGESAFGILSSPSNNEYIEVAVRKAGTVTNYLHSLKKGDIVTLRGPYGNGFPMDFFEGKDVVAITGGCGIPPIAAMMDYIAENRHKFGNVYLIYGAKDQSEILLKKRLLRWRWKKIKVILTVDTKTRGWKGNVGFVTDMIKKIHIDEKNAVAAMCGPGPMMDALEKVLKPLGISDKRIFVNMERKMQCGIGKCQHCTCGTKYVCKDGPVFDFDSIEI